MEMKLKLFFCLKPQNHLDIDYESEVIRSWGAVRFDIYAVINIIRRRKYPLKVELYDENDKLISTDDGESEPGKVE